MRRLLRGNRRDKGHRMGAYEEEIEALRAWMGSERFARISRVHTPAQVLEQRGTVPQEYTVARDAASQFHARLRELFAEGKSITSFGPYSPGQIVQMKRAGIEGIYLGGWATSAKGSTNEDPGPDLASYPAQPGARRGRRPRARSADGRQEPALRPQPDDRGRARRHPRGGLPPVPDRRRRHRPRRRRPRAQPRAALRRGRRPRLPHRGSEAGRQEVRTPGRQGPGLLGRADQAPQRGSLPARHHGSGGDHRRPHRRRGGQPARRLRRRARPALHPRRHQHLGAVVQGRLPRRAAAPLRRGHRGRQRSPASTPSPTRSTPKPTRGSRPTASRPRSTPSRRRPTRASSPLPRRSWTRPATHS